MSGECWFFWLLVSCTVYSDVHRETDVYSDFGSWTTNVYDTRLFDAFHKSNVKRTCIAAVSLSKIRIYRRNGKGIERREVFPSCTELPNGTASSRVQIIGTD